VRILWLLILILVVAAAVLLTLGGEDDGVDRSTTTATPPENQDLDEAPGTSLVDSTPAPPPAADPEPTTAEIAPQNIAAAPAPAVEGSLRELADQLALSATTRLNTGAPPPIIPTEEEVRDKPIVKAGLDVEIAKAEVIEGRIRQLSERSLWVDGEWTLNGSGTRADPYEPTWEYLFSAADTYQPRLGENEIPQRIALLDGKWVRIAGFTAFPLVVGETREMLVMLNKWDGCCIGGPPTPFDALEVHLNEAVQRGPKHSISFGTVTGRLKVDPYLIENWLVGLYILENSSLSRDP